MYSLSIAVHILSKAQCDGATIVASDEQIIDSRRAARFTHHD